MEKVKIDRIIKNEYLFRAMVCVPAAILFALLAVNSVATSGIVVFQVIFTLIAAYFSLSALFYAAHYTNERYEGKAAPLFKNNNLSKSIKFFPLAVLFTFTAFNSIATSASVVFQIMCALIAFILLLSTIAYAAFYTNDCYAEQVEH
ncbi:MAG: hypothetical protein ACPG46_10535 [Thalassotalea sp.]